jgi:hypothetical protein
MPFWLSYLLPSQKGAKRYKHGLLPCQDEMILIRLGSRCFGIWTLGSTFIQRQTQNQDVLHKEDLQGGGKVARALRRYQRGTSSSIHYSAEYRVIG